MRLDVSGLSEIYNIIALFSFSVLSLVILAVRKERCLRMAITDQELIQMALIGYEVKRAEIEAKIVEIQADLGGSSKRAMTSGATARAKPERLTAAARKRIAAAQKKRWAAFRAAKEAQASEAAKKAAP